MTKIVYKELSYNLQGGIFEVNKSLGHAFKESVYQKALEQELVVRGIEFENQKRISIEYKGIRVGTYVPDLIVEQKIIVELKSKPFLSKADHMQFQHYMKGCKYRIGYLVNFGKPGKVELIRKICDYEPQH
jgi:GxxExxY protein